MAVAGKFQEKLGGTCAQQLIRTRKLLSNIGIEMDFLRALNGSVHHAGIATVTGEQFFLDPSKGQRKPISLTKLFESKTPQFSEAFPTNLRTRRLITLVRGEEPETFSQHTTTFNATTGPSGKTDSEFFNLRNRDSEPPNSEIDCATILREEAIRMVTVLRCKNPKYDKDVGVVKVTADGKFTARFLGGPSEKKDVAFRIFRETARACGVKPKELREYLREALLFLIRDLGTPIKEASVPIDSVTP